MPDALCAEILDGFADIGAPAHSPAWMVTCSPACLASLKIPGTAGRKFRLVACQVQPDDAVLDVVGGEPGNLFGQLGAFVAVDGGDQARPDAVLFGGLPGAGADPVITSWSGKRSAG